MRNRRSLYRKIITPADAESVLQLAAEEYAACMEAGAFEDALEVAKEVQRAGYTMLNVARGAMREEVAA